MSKIPTLFAVTAVASAALFAACNDFTPGPIPRAPTPSPSPLLATPAPQPTPTTQHPTPSAQHSTVLPLPPLTHARAIHIEDDWSGDLDVAPVEAHYDLIQDGPGESSYSGPADFSVAGFIRRPPLTDHANVTIPADVARRFLDTLWQSSPEAIDYTPRESTSVANFPSLAITVLLQDETVIFFSHSLTPSPDYHAIFEGGDRVPWATTFWQGTYTINSNQPAKAYTLLQPYLKKDVLRNLIGRFLNIH